tara:strand:+ start:2722 stop:3543 length:822 start_codon:yes stop_codon:yes gene_type:complete
METEDVKTSNTTPEETQERVKANRKGRKKVEKKNEALETLSINYCSIDDVKPNTYNPNRQSDHDFELLLRSIEEDGFTQPIIVNQDYIVVDGEHRWRAANTLGYKKIPVVVVPMSEEQMKISTIRHNRARGSHDIQLEAEVLRDLQKLGALDWAQDSLMLDDLELNRLMEDISAPDALATEEFSEAWKPTNVSSEDQESEGVQQSSTFKAVEAMREREKRIEQAKTEEEKVKIKQESTYYRLNLIFADEEAKLVKAFLGDQPAVKILEICKNG